MVKKRILISTNSVPIINFKEIVPTNSVNGKKI